MSGFRKGFTIVELLIVVVVIAILAAITIVAYNGIRDRATTSAMQSDFSQTARLLESEKVKTGTDTFPSGAPTTLATGYTYNAVNSGVGYCLSRVYSGVNYFITSASTTPTKGSCEGLVGWWKMNGNVQDSSGFGQHGSLNSVTAASDNNGNANGALSFGGSPGRIEFSNTTISNSVKPGLPMTYSTWIRPTNISGARTLFQNDLFQCAAPALYNGIKFIVEGGALKLYMGNGGGCGGNSRYDKTTATTAVVNNTWQHIAFSIDASRNMSLYVNGVDLGGTYAGTATSIAYTTAPSLIGSTSDNTSYFEGLMDDTRLFNRALSPTEINNLYIAGAQ